MIYLIRAPQYEGRAEKKIADWIVKDWKKAGIEFEDLGGIVRPPIKHGVFYDDSDCIESYIEEFHKALKVVKDNDKILFIEGWNVSIPLYKLYFDSWGMNVKMFGLFPSAIHVPGEYFREFPWAYPFERVLYKCLTKVFVATPYIQKLTTSDNVVLTGLPLPDDIDIIGTEERKNIVIFSHRWSSDKHPEVFERLADKFHDRAEFWLLTPREEVVDNEHIKVIVNKTRQEYLDNLRKGKIIFSSAELETFGYSIVEGVMSGCLPLLINKTCYPDLYSEEFLYSNDKEMFKKFKKLINNEYRSNPMEKLEYNKESTALMLKHILDN